MSENDNEVIEAVAVEPAKHHTWWCYVYRNGGGQWFGGQWHRHKIDAEAEISKYGPPVEETKLILPA